MGLFAQPSPTALTNLVCRPFTFVCPRRAQAASMSQPGSPVGASYSYATADLCDAHLENPVDVVAEAKIAVVQPGLLRWVLRSRTSVPWSTWGGYMSAPCRRMTGWPIVLPMRFLIVKCQQSGEQG